MEIKKLTIPLLGAALVGGAITGVGLTAMAAPAPTSTTSTPNRGPGMGMGPSVMGTVTAVTGTTITVSGKDGATYTIDISGATVEKYQNGSSSTVGASSVAVGDTVAVNGKIQSATLSATDIHDGFPQPTPPAAMGKVTAVNGSTVTISAYGRPSGKGAAPTATTYTVDTSGASITKISAPSTKGTAPTETTISASDIAVGDMITVEGTVNGTSITATSITDGMGFGGRGRMGPPGGGDWGSNSGS